MFVLKTPADEESSYFPTIELVDEQDNAIAPTTLFWKLTDMKGNVINDREAEEISAPEIANIIPLTGDDLAMFEDAITYRLITVWGTYPSPSFGGDLSFRQQIQFPIRPQMG